MEFLTVCDELGISDTNKMLIASLLTPLRDKSPVTQFHYLHSLRVGLLARQIGRFIHHEEKPLLFAGALHDLGKCQTPLHILGRTDTWSEDRVRQELQNRGITPFANVSDITVRADFSGGKTTSVNVSGGTGSQNFDGAEFKNWFNLRAPKNIQIVGPLYNVELQ